MDTHYVSLAGEMTEAAAAPPLLPLAAPRRAANKKEGGQGEIVK